MTTFLPKEVQQGLDAARARDLARKSRHWAEMDGHRHRVQKYTQSGFAVAVEDAPHFRGLVDIYEGDRHVAQALIVASEEEAGQMWYEYKWLKPVTDGPALDFFRAPDAPAGLLTDER
jgi:hypothetical protein